MIAIMTTITITMALEETTTSEVMAATMAAEAEIMTMMTAAVTTTIQDLKQCRLALERPVVVKRLMIKR